MAPASLVQYLTSLPPVTLDRLYMDTWVCHALLRVLPPVARLYALRLAVVHGSLPASAVDAWPAKGREASVQHESAMRQLRSLRLVQLENAPSAQARRAEGSAQDSAHLGCDDAPTVRLHRAFAEQLIGSLGGGPAGLAQDATALHGLDKNAVHAEQLESLGAERWDSLLLIVLNPPNAPLPLAISAELASPAHLPRGDPAAFGRGAEGGAIPGGEATLQSLLAAAGLIEPAENTAGGGEAVPLKWRTSQAGRSYLLEPPSAQLWRLVLAYVSLCRLISPAAHDAALALALRLALLPAATDYPSDALSPPQRLALLDYTQWLGLAYTRKQNSRRFYATPYAGLLIRPEGVVAAAGGLAAVGSNGGAAEGSGFVIIETNFRVYAHSSSDLRARVLRSFCHLSYQLPGLIVASLTRQSVQAAVDSGVGVNAILGYLERNAHPIMAAQTPVLPETVVNQVHLWAKERERAVAAKCKLYDRFDSLAAFDAAATYATEAGIYLWSRRCAEERLLGSCALAVQADGHPAMKRFLAAGRQAQR